MYDVSVGKFDRKGTWGFVKEDISNPLSLFLHVVVCLYERKYADFITFNQKVHQSRKQQDQMTSKIFLCSTFFVRLFCLKAQLDIKLQTLEEPWFLGFRFDPLFTFKRIYRRRNFLPNVRFMSFGQVVECRHWCRNLIVYLLFCFLLCQKKPFAVLIMQPLLYLEDAPN